MKENLKLKTYKLPDIKNLKVHGRSTGCFSPLTLFWTGSAVELNTSGSELWIEVESDYDTYETWISIAINSQVISRQIIAAGRYWICIFRNMNENIIKNIRIIKDTQPMSSDCNSCFQIHSIKSDGEFFPVEEKPLKIEFIGDSITSGEGSLGSKAETDWISMWFSALNNYTAMTADILNADYRIISQSGWGVLTSYDNNPNNNIPKYYDKICGIPANGKNESLGALKENDFESWQPDFIVVNLGTNDFGAFNNPEWKDKSSGKIYKQHLNEDGTFDENDIKAFRDAVINFILKLRKYNKNAHIIWAYGMIGIQMMPTIYDAVNIYIKETRDNKVSVFQLPTIIDESTGALSHPGKLSHQKSAKELSLYIKSIL
ncbi:MAG: SGNH/GDSL hydrolase family protein [Bacillota bacterium]|nr:SGNH/GDSL hydrolase family protein [Bacillota bacterium]